MSSRHSASFSSSFFHYYHLFYHLQLPPSHQGKFYLGILPLFLHNIFHSCHHLYHLHLTTPQQDECHLVILPLFPHHFFHSCHHLYLLHLPPYQQEKCHVRILPLFTFILYHPCHLSYHLHLPQYQQGKCHPGIQPLFPHNFFILVIFSITYTFLNINRVSVIWALRLFPHSFFHSCHIFYHLHLPPSQQGKCHLVIFPLFPHHLFIPVIFSIIYTFLHINSRSVIWDLCLTYIHHIWRCDLGEC